MALKYCLQKYLIKNSAFYNLLPIQCRYLLNGDSSNYFIVFHGKNQLQSFVTSHILLSEKKNQKPGVKITKVRTEDGVVEVEKKIYQPRVSLLYPDCTMQVVTLDEAQKIGRRRNLKVYKVCDRDPKAERPVYRLLSLSNFNEQKKKENKRANAKDEKLLNLNANISEHDLQTKIKNILKWLESEHTVKISLSGDEHNPAPMEKIYSLIFEGVGNAGRVVQKICKRGEMKFQVILPKKPKVNSSNSRSAGDSTESSSSSELK